MLSGPDSTRRMRILVDDSHGEELHVYQTLASFLTSCCEVVRTKKKPLSLEALVSNDAAILISPGKGWEKSEIEAMYSYVAAEAGVLVVFTLAGRKPEKLNELLQPLGLSIVDGEVREKYLRSSDLQGAPELLEGIGTLMLGTVFGAGSAVVGTESEAKCLLVWDQKVLAARRPLGKGNVYLFSCLPAFGNWQLEEVNVGNRRLVRNLLGCLGTPAMLAASVDSLVERLGQQIAKRRVDAVVPDVLGMLGSDRGVESLQQLMNDKRYDLGMRRKIPFYLAYISTEHAIQTLIEALDDRSPAGYGTTVDTQNVGDNAIEALVRLGRAAVAQVLREWGGLSTLARGGALRVLSMSGDERATGVLIESLASKDSYLTPYLAADGLKRIGKPAHEALTAALGSQDETVRVLAQEILQEIQAEPRT